MKRFNSIEELKPYLNEGTNTYVFDDDVTLEFNLDVSSDITAYNIDAHNIDALNINADDINAININALDINANAINAKKISYYALCIAYQSFSCENVEGRRHNSIHKCLDGDIVFKKSKQTVTLELTKEQLNDIKKLLEESK